MARTSHIDAFDEPQFQFAPAPDADTGFDSLAKDKNGNGSWEPGEDSFSEPFMQPLNDLAEWADDVAEATTEAVQSAVDWVCNLFS